MEGRRANPEPRRRNLTGILSLPAEMALCAVEDLLLMLSASDLPIGKIALIPGAGIVLHDLASRAVTGTEADRVSVGAGCVPRCAAGVLDGDWRYVPWRAA
jgi:hypothetical protein